MQDKERHAAYMRTYYAKRRSDWIESQGGKCVICGSVKDLEVDHVDRTQKEIQVGRLWTRRKEVRDAELAKCQVLCADCHQMKTGQELGVPHGGGVCGKRGCKCEPCRLKKNQYLKLLKRERRARGLKD